MGSRLFDEIREQRGLAYSVHSIAHAYADVPVLQLSAGLESSKMLEAYRRMRDIVTELRERRPDRGRGRARPRLRRRRPRDRVREHRRDRPPRRPADDRLRRGRRPRSDDRAARRGNVRRGERGRRARRRRAVGGVRRPAHGGGARVSLTRRIVGGIAVTAVIAGCGGGGHAQKPSSDASVGAPIAHTATTADAADHAAPCRAGAAADPVAAADRAAGRAVERAGQGRTADRRARLRPDRQDAAVLAAGQRRPPAGVGREALHDGRDAQRARPERPLQTTMRRRRPPRPRRRLAREPVSGRRRRPDVRRRRLQPQLGAGLRPHRQPAREPARRTTGSSASPAG